MASQLAIGPRARSSSGISAIVGPSVINRKLSDAGYFVVLRNEKNAGIGGVALQGRGSPYRLNPRRTRKSAMAPSPRRRHVRLRRAGSNVRIVPKAYPAAITPIHGIIEYSTIRGVPSTGPLKKPMYKIFHRTPRAGAALMSGGRSAL